MFARLTYNPGMNNASAQTIFATLINIITGTTTSNTQLDASVFNRSASYIINGAGAGANTGWYVVDSQANLVANAALTTPPVVIGSPWSDSSFYGKYLYLAPTYTSNLYPNFVSLPMDGWQANTKSTANGVFYASSGASFTNLAGGTVFNSSNNTARWYDFMNHQGGFSPSMHSTIISSSNTHLLIANFSNYAQWNFGTPRSTPTLANYFFLSEYSRDDAWNTAASGFPSWFAEGGSVPNIYNYVLGNQWSGPAYQNVTTAASGGSSVLPQHFGIAAAGYSTVSNTVNLAVPMYRTAVTGVETALAGSTWGITTRFFNWAAFSAFVGQTNYNQAFSTSTAPPYSRGLAQAGNAIQFLGNQNLTRDANKNPAVPIAELRFTVWNENPDFYGANTLWSGGSISGVTPYIYATSSRFNNFDEITLGSNTYMVINFNQSQPSGAAAAPQYVSNMLILER